MWKFVLNKKACSKCKRVLSINSFHRNRCKKSGRADWCKDCQNEYGKKWRANNKEKIYETNKKWRINNKEKYNETCRIAMKKYRENNREKYNERCRIANRKCYYNNLEESRKKARNWQRKKKEKINAEGL